MRRMIWRTAALLLAMAGATAQASNIVGDHRVQEVKEADLLLINFNGLPVLVRLAHIKPGKDAAPKLAEMLKDQPVRLELVDELRSDDAGRPMVYVLKTGKQINVELVRLGLAAYDASKEKSARYHEHFSSAESSAKRQKLGIWADGTAAVPLDQPPKTPNTPKTPDPAANPTTPAPQPAPPGPANPTTLARPAAEAAGGRVPATAVYSELRSSQYHAADCRYGKRIAANNLICYASPDKAEQAGKRACFLCQNQRAEEGAFGGKTAGAAALAAGKLIGLKSDKLFHSPVCGYLKKAQRADMAGFATLDEAKASGRQACFECLRLNAPPGAPPCLPQTGECIGRCPPYFRPCMRAPADPSGLCLMCQGKE